MAKQVKSDKKVQRAMLALFREADKHGQVNCEAAITEAHLNVCDRKSIVEIRDRYTAAAGVLVNAEVLMLIDKFIARRTRQSPLLSKPTEADIAALYAAVVPNAVAHEKEVRNDSST